MTSIPSAPFPSPSTPPPPPPGLPRPPLPAGPRSPRRRPLGFFGILLIVGLVGGFLLLIAGAVFLAVVQLEGDLLPEAGGMQEETLMTGTDEGKVALISVSGVITGDGSYVQGSEMVFEITSQLRRAGRDGQVKAVILQVDSPGGGLTASDLIYAEVKRLRDTCMKPVIVWVGDMAASGGYYIAAPANHIIVSPTAIVGSIGVIMERFMIRDLLEQKLGIKSDPIMAGESKDIGSMFREMTAEERKFFQGLLTHFHDRFISIVAQGRRLPEQDVRALADGKIFVPEEALARGLVDEIGYFDSALEKAKELGGVSKPGIVRYRRRFSWVDMLQAGAESPLGNLGGLARELRAAATPRLRAQWTGMSSP